jgi:hypothetical protein
MKVEMIYLPIGSEAYVCERQFVNPVKSDLRLVASQKAVSRVDWHQDEEADDGAEAKELDAAETTGGDRKLKVG